VQPAAEGHAGVITLRAGVVRIRSRRPRNHHIRRRWADLDSGTISPAHLRKRGPWASVDEDGCGVRVPFAMKAAGRAGRNSFSPRTTTVLEFTGVSRGRCGRVRCPRKRGPPSGRPAGTGGETFSGVDAVEVMLTAFQAGQSFKRVACLASVGRWWSWQLGPGPRRPEALHDLRAGRPASSARRGPDGPS